MITVTITIQKETMEEVLNVLTDLELNTGDDEFLRKCEDARDKLVNEDELGDFHD